MKDCRMGTKKLLTGDALLARAKDLGVVTSGDNIINIPGEGTVPLPVSEYELQRRVLEVERHVREHSLWLVALISSAASAISAAAAWLAIIYK